MCDHVNNIRLTVPSGTDGPSTRQRHQQTHKSINEWGIRMFRPTDMDPRIQGVIRRPRIVSIILLARFAHHALKQKHKNQINHYNKQRRILMTNSTVCQSKWKPIVEPRLAKPMTYPQAPAYWLKFYEEVVIESEARIAVVQLKSEA